MSIPEERRAPSGEPTGNRSCALVVGDRRILNHVNSHTIAADIARMPGLIARGPSTVVAWKIRNEEMRRCAAALKEAHVQAVPSESRWVESYFAKIAYSPGPSPWEPFLPWNSDLEATDFFIPRSELHRIELPWEGPYERQDEGDGLGQGGAPKRYARFLGQAAALLGPEGVLEGAALETLYQVANHLFSIEVAYLLHKRHGFHATSNEAVMMAYANEYLVPAHEDENAEEVEPPADTEAERQQAIEGHAEEITELSEGETLDLTKVRIEYLLGGRQAAKKFNRVRRETLRSIFQEKMPESSGFVVKLYEKLDGGGAKYSLEMP